MTSDVGKEPWPAGVPMLRPGQVPGCFYVVANEHGGGKLVWVRLGVPGYLEIDGKAFARFEDAEACAARLNERQGVSESMVFDIVGLSMRAQGEQGVERARLEDRLEEQREFMRRQARWEHDDAGGVEEH